MSNYSTIGYSTNGENWNKSNNIVALCNDIGNWVAGGSGIKIIK